jgi:hypothetical protein
MLFVRQLNRDKFSHPDLSMMVAFIMTEHLLSVSLLSKSILANRVGMIDAYITSTSVEYDQNLDLCSQLFSSCMTTTE